MAGRTLQTTVPIRSTTVEKSNLRVYCRSATSSNRASMARGLRACSRAARAMTVTGVCSANRSKMVSRTMVPPPWDFTISRCGDTLADASLQLQSPAHDFLVPSVREWGRKDRQALQLVEAISLAETKNVPQLIEKLTDLRRWA